MDLENPHFPTIHVQPCGNRIYEPEYKEDTSGKVFPRMMKDIYKNSTSLKECRKENNRKSEGKEATNGYHFLFSERDPARITGSTGSTHGARIVRIQARKEEMRSVINGIISNNVPILQNS